MTRTVKVVVALVGVELVVAALIGLGAFGWLSSSPKSEPTPLAGSCVHIQPRTCFALWGFPPWSAVRIYSSVAHGGQIPDLDDVMAPSDLGPSWARRSLKASRERPILRG